MNEGVRQDALIPAHLMAGLLLTTLILFAAFRFASQPITLTVYPRFAMAPTRLSIQVHVPRDPANRVVRVETDGGDYVRASAWELEGEHAPTVFTVDWPNVPEGEYLILASVLSATAIRGTDRVSVSVR